MSKRKTTVTKTKLFFFTLPRGADVLVAEPFLLVLLPHRDVDHQPVQRQRLPQRALAQEVAAVLGPYEQPPELAVPGHATGLEVGVVGGEVGLEDGALVLGGAVQRAEQVFGVGGEFDELEIQESVP